MTANTLTSSNSQKYDCVAKTYCLHFHRVIFYYDQSLKMCNPEFKKIVHILRLKVHQHKMANFNKREKKKTQLNQNFIITITSIKSLYSRVKPGVKLQVWSILAMQEYCTKTIANQGERDNWKISLFQKCTDLKQDRTREQGIFKGRSKLRSTQRTLQCS